MNDLKRARFGTFANDLLMDGDTDEYGLVIWLGTKDEAEAKKIADELSEAWNSNTDPEVKQ